MEFFNTEKSELILAKATGLLCDVRVAYKSERISRDIATQWALAACKWLEIAREWASRTNNFILWDNLFHIRRLIWTCYMENSRVLPPASLALPMPGMEQPETMDSAA